MNAFKPKDAAVALLIAAGHNMKSAALLFGVSAKTVEYHKKKVGNLVGSQNPVDIARYVMRTGLVNLSERA
jgi:DNA-binding NarL/FixJ family response regulator